MYGSNTRYVTSLGACALLIGWCAAAQAGTGTGEAYGVAVELGAVTVAKTPYVVLPADGSRDPIENELLSFDEPGTVRSSTLHVQTQGRITGNNGTISSAAIVEELNLLAGLVTADLVAADSTSGQHTDQGQQKSARISSGGATFSGLIVAGMPISNSPPPNTEIPVAGVGIVILNEQIETGDNSTNSSLTVNAIHVVLMDGIVPVGHIIVSSAHSGVDYRR